MPFDSPPRTACWQHHGLRSGFEVVYFNSGSDGFGIEGTTTGIQDGVSWVVRYTVELDALWNTRRATVTTRTASGIVDRLIESVRPGHWVIDGVEAADLEGCRDVDLESSALTNAFPVHRLGLAVGEGATAPAVYVPLATAGVERLDQRYDRVTDEGSCQRYHYEAPRSTLAAVSFMTERAWSLTIPGWQYAPGDLEAHASSR